MTAQQLEHRLRILLPESYQDRAVEPRSMGSAALKFGPDGKVPWNQMWGSFCHLAMAGGPPHRGKLLAFPTLTHDEAQTPAYHDAAAEICRGLGLVTGLCAEPAPTPGLVRLYCTSAAMSAWLMRAITMENVTAIAHGLSIDLPVAPPFRVEKEIKNVITAVAKTYHYWQDHMSDAKHDAVAALLREMEAEHPIVRPAPTTRQGAGSPRATPEEPSSNALAVQVTQTTRLTTDTTTYPNWLGLHCPTVAAAVWLMRALAVHNLLARREEATVYVPHIPATETGGEHTLRAIVDAHTLAQAAGIL